MCARYAGIVLAVLPWVVWVVGASGDACAQVQAASADDVCAPTTDPCVISQTVEVQAGATLDFGTRAVIVSAGGVLDFGDRRALVLSGDFTVDVDSSVGIDVNRVVAGTPQGGTANLVARRSCSGDPLVPCVTDADCQGLSLGTCSVGSGNLTINGRVQGSGETPASISLVAAGDMQIDQVVNLAGTTADSDGGIMDVKAVAGSVVLNKALNAPGGSFCQGGELTVVAGTDIIINAPIDLSGGDSDGGVLDFTSGRDTHVRADLLMSAKSGGGFGGDLTMIAGRDLTIQGGTSSNNLLVITDGHASADGFAGDGGSEDFSAEGKITLGPFVRLQSNGAPPDGFGGDISLASGGDLVIQGKLQAKAKGGQGAGGFLDVLSGANLDFASGADVDLSGGNSDAGIADCSADGDANFAGSADVSASNGGTGGAFALNVGGDLRVSGSLAISGVAGLGAGSVVLSGCLVELMPGALLDNRVDQGENRLIGRSRILVDAGSSMSASGLGADNVLVFRDSSVPPVVAGSVTPAPTLVVNTGLVACPACGNAVLDPGETCDDGNTTSGDGCSFACQDEGCVAGTPGFPAVDLCDDRQACSADSCNTVEHRCDHVFPCDDGIACTVESCVGSTCINTPSDSLCDDGNGCTLDTCIDGVGCGFTTATDGTVCDDGSFCNGTDSCTGGTCSVHTGDPCPGVSTGCAGLCNETNRSCLSPAGTPCASDGNICTDDECDGRGICAHRFNFAPCSDGIYCNGPDICVAGSCLFHRGNPCAFGPQCGNHCNEASATCVSPHGTFCVADANVCTDDACDGAGSCVAALNTVVCDDKDFCTVTDRCSQGNCTATDQSFLTRARFKSVVKPGGSNDKLILKAESAVSAFTTSPIDAGMAFHFFDASGVEFYSAVIPASAFEAVGFSGTKFRFRDRDGAVTSANGMQRVAIRIKAGKDLVKIRTKTAGVELPGAVGQSSGSVSIVLGSDPSVDACFTGKGMFCTGTPSRLTCKTR